MTKGLRALFLYGGSMDATFVKLSGDAGRRFGREFKLHLETKTPSEAIRALCAVVSGFREYLANASSRGIEFALWRGKGTSEENIGVRNLREPAGGAIRIAPVHAGAKNGGFIQTIVGGALIGISFIPGLQAALPIGVSLVAGGVIQMISPQPKARKPADSPENQASDIFNGAVNTTAQGNCVPVLYGGPMEIGSVVISAGIEAMDYSSRPSNVGLGTANGSQKLTPYDPD